MTQNPEPAVSPKPKAPVAAKPAASPPANTPKPKPPVAAKPAASPSGNSPKPKPAVAAKPVGGVRLAAFETYQRTDSVASGAAKGTVADESPRTKPVAKKRLINIFPGGTPRL